VDLSSLGKAVVIVGAVLLVVGGLLWLAGRTGFPLGRLPGDIRIDRGAWSCTIPLVSMIVLSLLLTIILNVIVRVLNR
jgi:chorismate-pyruvate lyase